MSASSRTAKLPSGIRYFLPRDAGEEKMERMPNLILCVCSSLALPWLFWFPVARGTTRRRRSIAGSGWNVQAGRPQWPAQVIRPISTIAPISIPTKCKEPVAAAVVFQPHRSVPAEPPASGLAQPSIQRPRPARQPVAWAEPVLAVQPQQPRTLRNHRAPLRLVVHRPPAPQRPHRIRAFPIRAFRTPVLELGLCPEFFFAGFFSLLNLWLPGSL